MVIFFVPLQRNCLEGDSFCPKKQGSPWSMGEIEQNKLTKESIKYHNKLTNN